jgi:hypothetical protein
MRTYAKLAAMTAVSSPPGASTVVVPRRAPGSFLRPSTSPAKLRLLLAGLLLLCLIWGVLAELTAVRYASAANNVVVTSEPLSLDAQQIYRSLSDADSTVASAFLAGGIEPLAARHRYQGDIARAARLLAAAAALTGHSAATRQLATIAVDLPVYAGEVETARADARLGLPLGAAYLREASGLMRSVLLPAAFSVFAAENARLNEVSGQATGLPLAVITIVVGVLTVLALVRAQRWLSGRTHRRLNAGLVVTSVAAAVSLIWLAAVFIVARSDLHGAASGGSAPVQLLASADIAALQAHADESLTLIDNSGDDSYQADFANVQLKLSPPGGLLATAAGAAAGSPAAATARAATSAATAWFAAHRRVRSLDNHGSHTAAVQSAIGAGPADSGELFRRLESDLSAAISADQAVFSSRALAGRDAFTGLEAGVIVAAVVMVAGCARGLSRRLAEYR